MPVRSSLRGALFLALLSPAFGKAVEAQSQPASKPSTTATSDASMPMPQVAPLFIENGYFTSSLFLLNAAATHTFADVTLRTANGHAVLHKRVEFQPNSERKLEIQELLRQVDYKEIFGSIELTSDNNGVVIGQIAITHQAADDESLIDEEFAMPMHGDSACCAELAVRQALLRC